MLDIKDITGYLVEPATLKDFTTVSEQDPAFVQNLLSQVMELEVKLRDQQNLIEGLERDAMTDSLTGLVNRRVFENELEKSLSSAKRYKRRGALMFVDIDAFKSINDQFGHLAGDQALKHIANILKQNVRPMDVVARLGGDEFCVILGEVNSARDVCGRAEFLESLIARTPLIFDEKTIHLTVSIGGKSFTGNDTIESIMGDADSSMYAQKFQKVSR